MCYQLIKASTFLSTQYILQSLPLSFFLHTFSLTHLTAIHPLSHTHTVHMMDIFVPQYSVCITKLFNIKLVIGTNCNKTMHTNMHKYVSNISVIIQSVMCYMYWSQTIWFGIQHSVSSTKLLKEVFQWPMSIFSEMGSQSLIYNVKYQNKEKSHTTIIPFTLQPNIQYMVILARNMF